MLMPIESVFTLPATAYLSLGSNLGDRESTLMRATDAIDRSKSISVRAVSPLYETDAVGGPTGQPRYINAAIRVETSLPPEQLLECAGQIECALGRRRLVVNGPRTIDIDILLFGHLVRCDRDPILPHPRMHERAFVLQPLSHLAADVVHPVLGRTIQMLLDELSVARTVTWFGDSSWWTEQNSQPGCASRVR